MKYYIFDLDGTLADSMGYWYGSFRGTSATTMSECSRSAWR